MRKTALSACILLAVLTIPVDRAGAEGAPCRECGDEVNAETPYGKGLSEANKERLVLDDMEDVSDWYNGSPEETTISASDKHVKQGRLGLRFANVVDYTKGEKKYPIGWPRIGKDLRKVELTDWSAYDFFECWIYVETSRKALPGDPLGLGFYHSGPKRTSSWPLKELTKDQWLKVVIPISKLLDPNDIQRVQFNISESNYKHGDRVDFYLDDMVLTRYVDPAVVELVLERRIVFAGDRQLVAAYRLSGRKGMDQVKVELAIGQGAGTPAAKTTAAAARQGEIVLPLNARLAPGTYWARLGLRDAQGKLIDRKQAEFRVIEGPF